MVVGYMVVVEDMVVEGMVVEGMEVWPRCTQVLPLISLTIVTGTTRLTPTGPTPWRPHALPNHKL